MPPKTTSSSSSQNRHVKQIERSEQRSGNHPEADKSVRSIRSRSTLAAAAAAAAAAKKKK